MKNKIYVVIMLVGLIAITSCAKNEECVCNNSENLTDSDAKDAGVTLETACELAKNGDESCSIQ